MHQSFSIFSKSNFKKDVQKIKNLLFNNVSTKQTIAKNTSWLFTAEGISKLLMLFLIVLIARYLGALDYGKFAFAFAALFAVIANFGLLTLTIREIAKDKSLASKYMENIAIIKLILSVITFALIALAINLMNYLQDTTYAVYPFGLYVILASFSQIFRSIFKVFEVIKYESLITILNKLITVVFFVDFTENKSFKPSRNLSHVYYKHDFNC